MKESDRNIVYLYAHMAHQSDHFICKENGLSIRKNNNVFKFSNEQVANAIVAGSKILSICIRDQRRL